MASLLMRHLDGFRDEIATVDIAIDKLDDTILRTREKRSPLMSLAALRRKLADLRAVLKGQRSVIHGLVTPDFLAHVPESDRAFLIEANRVFERLEDDVTRARETVIGSFELYASRVAQDTNQLVKVLTIATVITGVIGAVAGVFGMNFDTPIAHSGFPGFLLVTGAMIAVSVAIIAVALWQRWV
jgi:Mg2+ and Co2+ transporter CorA